MAVADNNPAYALPVGKIVRAAKRTGLRTAFQVLRVYWIVRRPKAVGVKCADVDEALAGVPA